MVMDRLRSPGGCPWDAEQTHASLVPHLIEETYEVIQAIDTGTRADLAEELGDLLLQVVFHARLAQEHPDEPFGMTEVAAGIAAKLRRRHPHVFGDAQAESAQQVHEQWVRLKQQEKQRPDPLEGIPAGLPTLVRARKVLSGLQDAGVSLDLPDMIDAVHLLTTNATNRTVGEALLSVIDSARACGIDADEALRTELSRRTCGDARVRRE